MSHLSFITSVKYWLKSVPLHSHFTICNSVQCFCIILSRFICHKWTSQTLHTMQLPVFTAYSASIYTDIYKLIAVNTSIHQPCWHMQPSKILFRCDYSLFWKKWPKFRYVWMPPHADSKKTCLQTFRHNKGEECMWIKTRKYWTCSVSLICMPAHQSTLTTALEYQDRNHNRKASFSHLLG